MRLVTIRVHGPLADRYGHEHRLAIASPREAVDAIDCNHPGFRRDMMHTSHYALFIDGEWLDERVGLANVPHYPVQREIDICPVVEGRLTALIAPAVAFVTGMATASFAVQLIAGVIALGLSVGLSLLLAPKVKKKPSEDETKNTESYIFSGPENVTEQGVAVPLVYGYVHTGSVVVSAGLEVSEIPIAGVTTGSTRMATAVTATASATPEMTPLGEPEPLLVTTSPPTPTFKVPFVPPDPERSGRLWRGPNA